LSSDLTAQRLERAIRLLYRGFFAATTEELDRRMQEFVEEGNLTGQVRCLNLCGVMMVLQNRDEDAVPPLLQATELLQRTPGPPNRGHFLVWTNLIRTYGRVYQPEAGLALVDQVSPVIHLADPDMQHAFHLNRGGLYEIAQAWEPLLVASLAARRTALAAQNPGWAASAGVNLGIAQMEVGLSMEAERSLVEAIPVLSTSDPLSAAVAESALSRLYLVLGQDERAVQVGRSALHRFFESAMTPDKGEIGNISFSFGQIFAKYGQRNLALKYLNRAAAYFSQIGSRPRWLRTNEAIGQLLLSPVRPARADLREEMYQLDFLTALLDLTDDLESVEPTLRGHSDRVSLLALHLGRHCGLADAELRRLAHAARLHDVGKSAIDADLLRRQGALSQLEERRVSLHPVLGEEMVRPYGMEADGLAGIRHHHEHWDGSGFPDCLAREEIPLFARMISVVNSYDVWTFGVGDRPVVTHEVAMNTLLAQAGTVFDPSLVTRFLELCI
jgi:HD-GYP domain-containing protein (c-di-GMP phosphodiesterase class II)